MSIFSPYDKPSKQGITKDAPKQGAALFFDVLRREIFNLIKLNLLFILFCIPVITIPAAMTAMSKILFLMLKDKPHELWGDFFECFKKEFLRSLAVGFAIFILIGISVFSFYFYSMAMQSPAFSLILRAVLVALMAAFLIAAFYAFPLIALTDLPVKHIVKNAFLLTALMLPKNLLALTLFVLLWFIALLFYPYSLALVLIIFFSLSGLITSFNSLGGIHKYIIK